MMDSVAKLKLAQTSQDASLASRAATEPGRAAALSAFWKRNLTLDGLFYDIKSITEEETKLVSDQDLAREGAILIVPPPGSADTLTICASPDEFLRSGGAEVSALAVAGVGSSGLGAAALARNVATATGKPVAAVVSGYGFSDLASEALGGWFWFGTLNRLRHGFELLDATARASSPFTFEAMARKTEAKTPLAQVSLDVWTVLQLLGDPQFSFNLMVGHSKGNLVISEALYALGEVDEMRLATIGESTRIVTIGARIAMPPACRKVTDVMGTADALGELNSSPAFLIPTDIPVRGAGHHTNTDYPGHVDVADVVRQALAK